MALKPIIKRVTKTTQSLVPNHYLLDTKTTLSTSNRITWTAIKEKLQEL